MVTVGSIIVAVPLGVAAALCLSDILPFALRQTVKPVIEILGRDSVGGIRLLRLGDFCSHAARQRRASFGRRKLDYRRAYLRFLAVVVISDVAAYETCRKKSRLDGANRACRCCLVTAAYWGLSTLADICGRPANHNRCERV